MTELMLDAPTVRSRGRSRPTLAVAATGTFLALIAYTLPLSDLGTVARALSAGPTAQIWILSSMSLGLTAAMLLAGTLADRHGHRRMFLLGTGVSVIGALLGLISAVASPGLQPSIFITGRVVEGIGAAAVIAGALALIGQAFPEPAERAVASSAWGAALGAGIAAGPFVSALATAGGAWWSAYLAVAASTAGLGFASRSVLVESRATGSHPLDVAGTATFVAAAVLGLIALVSVRTTGGLLPVILAILAVLALGGFLALELRQRRPMLELRLFRDPRFAGAHLSAFVTGLGSIGLMSVASTYLIIELGLSGVQTAALIGIWSGTSTIAALAARWLPITVQGAGQLGIGLIGIGIGQLMLITTGSVLSAVPGLLVAGLAAGVVNAGLGRETAASAPRGRIGLGSGVNNTARYLGSAIGVTICAALLFQGGTSPTLLRAGWHQAVLLASVIALVGGAAVLVLARARSRSTAPTGSAAG